MVLFRNLMLVKVDIAKQKIVLPEDAEDMRVVSATHGEVVGVGPDCVTIEEGMTVHYKAYVGNQIDDPELGEGTFIIVSEEDALLAFKK